ncbi:MAG: aldehyde dehydrogenase family protein [bacterium]
MTLPHYTHRIAGNYQSTQKATITAPFDQAPIATLDLVDCNGVRQALAIAERTFADRSQWLSQPERIAILERSAKLMQSRRQALATQAAAEGGKPLIDSEVEVDRAIDGLKIAIDVLRSDGGKEIPMGATSSSMGRMAHTRRFPIGIVVAISAFNHPLNLIVHQVAPAVATGCPVIVKPAQDTPISCMLFLDILYEAGLPPAWAQGLVTDSNDTAGLLVKDNRVDFFTFIGSANVGWWLRSQLSPGTRCALEHGGVAPVVIADDADLDAAIPLLSKGGFYHAGQVCVSVQRVFVSHTLAKEVARRLTEVAQQLRVGDPTLHDTEVGPLIRPGEVQRIHDWVQEAINAGARLCCGGVPISDTCYAPTVLLNPPTEVTISQQEVFGPVICIYEYQDISDAINHANSLDVAFQAAVFTQSLDTALRAYREFDAAAVMVNDHTAFRVDWMPFAGLKQSGLGIGGIPYTMHDMQVEKMLVIKSKELD